MSQVSTQVITHHDVYLDGQWVPGPEAVAVARRIRTGQVDVNGAAFNVSAPFGGFKQSGNGRELGKEGIDEFQELKAIQLPQRDQQSTEESQ